MARRALFVGIDSYDPASGLQSLKGSVRDAHAMRDLLARNEDRDNSVNFDCRLLSSSSGNPATRANLRRKLDELFRGSGGDLLFYFSGHGSPSGLGGFLVTQDGIPGDMGISMNEVVQRANTAQARSVLLILDCCHSGSADNVRNPQGRDLENHAHLAEGVTILAASRANEVAVEVGGHGAFTYLVLSALRGAAADLRGRVSAASIYAYAEAAFGGWEQRPLYKSHASQLDPVRLCTPKVDDERLRRLPEYFPTADSQFRLDRTYEETEDSAIPEHVAIFRTFKMYQVAGLLKCELLPDLYWTAMESQHVNLTHLGRFYRQLAIDERV